MRVAAVLDGMGDLVQARARIEEARSLLAGSAPQDWRSTAAREFADRLAEHVLACEGALAAVARAAAAVRAYEAEAAAARAALSPFVGLSGGAATAPQPLVGSGWAGWEWGTG